MSEQAEDDFLSNLAGGDDDADDAAPDDAASEAALAVPSGGNSPAAPASAPGAAPGPGAGGPADNPNRDHVSNLNSALREVRGENKQLREQIAALTAKIDGLAKPASAAGNEQQDPDFLADPKGYVDATKKQLKDLEDKLEKGKKEEEDKQKAQQQVQETWNKVISAEAEFAAATPDYHDALNHVRGVLRTQIELANPDLEDQIRAEHPEATDEQVKQEANSRIHRQIQIQEFQGAAHLLSKGRNPSKVYYDYAKALGYKPKAAAPAQPAPAAKPDKDAVRTMGSGGGDGVPRETEGRSSLLPELSMAHAELKEDRKRSVRSR